MIIIPKAIQSLGALRVISMVFLFIAIAYNILSLFVYAFIPQLEKLAFPMLGGLRMSPSFADLRWVTALSGCGVNLDELAQGKILGCDPYGRPGLGYPPLSVEAARFLHVRGEHTGIIGFAMGLALIGVVLSMLFSLHNPGWHRDLFSGLVLLSFPLQMALERSNIDIVVFLLLTSLAATLAASKRWAVPLAAGISWLTVSIKLYPIAGIFAWISFSMLRRPRLDWVRSSSLLGATLGLAVVLPWFLKYGKGAAQPAAGAISHGLVVPLPLDQLAIRAPLLGKLAEIAPQPILGLIIFMLTLTWCVRVHIYDDWEILLVQKSVGYSRRCLHIIPALLGCVWLGCYFLSASFDYRLILALPAFTCLLALLNSSGRGQPPTANLLLKLVAAAGFTSFLLPLIPSNLLPTQFTLPLYGLSLFSDLCLMPVVAGAISALILPISITKNS